MWLVIISTLLILCSSYKIDLCLFSVAMTTPFDAKRFTTKNYNLQLPPEVCKFKFHVNAKSNDHQTIPCTSLPRIFIQQQWNKNSKSSRYTSSHSTRCYRLLQKLRVIRWERTFDSHGRSPSCDGRQSILDLHQFPGGTTMESEVITCYNLSEQTVQFIFAG